MLIGRELEDRGITTPAAIGEALGMPAREATSLLTRHQWREGDVALLQAAATRLGVHMPMPHGSAGQHVAAAPQRRLELLLHQLLDEPTNPAPQAASIGSNQASPANSPCSAVALLLSLSMAWSPPALERRSWLVEQAGDYATQIFHYIRDGT